MFVICRVNQTSHVVANPGESEEGGHVTLSGQASAVVLGIMALSFIGPWFQISGRDTVTVLVMVLVTGLVSLLLVVDQSRTGRDENPHGLRSSSLLKSFLVSSLICAVSYSLVHLVVLNRGIKEAGSDAVSSASVAAGIFVIFSIFIFTILAVMAFTLARGHLSDPKFCRPRRWIVYPVVVLAALTVVWTKNFNVVRADIYMKEGDRFREIEKWDDAISLHHRAHEIDKRQDQYALVLAGDYLKRARIVQTPDRQRAHAWERSEYFAHLARRLNPYNPAQAVNLGRFYLAAGRLKSRDHLGQALTFFEKVIILAPTKVVYHNLLAHTQKIAGDDDAAIARLKHSLAIDDQFPKT